MNTVTVSEYAQALRRMMKQEAPSSELVQAVDAIADNLLRAGRRRDLRRLLERIEEMGASGTPVTRVWSADSMPAAAEARFGGDTRLQTSPELIAGVRVQTGDRLVRASVRDRLDSLLSSTV